jgi:hypothetical protein
MYLATSAGVFYRLDMSLIPANSGPATGPAVIVKTGNPSLQLSFSCDFSVLWAQNYENNQWLTVNTGAFGGKEGEKVEREQKKVFFQFQKGGGTKKLTTSNFFSCSSSSTATGGVTPRFTLPIPGQLRGLRDLGGASCSCA